MSKRMTVVFEYKALYTRTTVEAARKGIHAKDIVAEAFREWLDAREDEEPRIELEEARREWVLQGGLGAIEFLHDSNAMPAP